ncbi:hypothetical protein BGX31_008838 [Mortierella sp. GBA43]|nr:hypothetical protein BGX31_008838 [Mortierella sp. GBA43]
MPTTISLPQPTVQGPTMHQQSVLSSPPSPSYFSQKPRDSFASFDSRQSVNSNDDEDSPANRPTLHQILLNQGRGQYTLDNFGAFLQAQFCYENLAFWLASKQYKLCAQSLFQSVHESVPMFNLHTESVQYLNPSQARAFSDLQRKMRAILDTFVLPSSPHELNLSDAVRCKLVRSVAEGNYHPQVLEQAREAIMDLMKCSSYPLFVEGIVARRASSSAGSSQSQSDDKHHQDGSWRHKAKHHFRLVSRMLKRGA